MRIEFDRAMCAGKFQCIGEWDAFEMNMIDGKADLDGAEEVDENFLVREVSNSFKEQEAIAAAESCPLKAIKVFEKNEKIAPSE